MNGPAAAPMPARPTIVPMARSRRSGGNASLSTAMLVGKSMAAPAPCTTRAATSQSSDGAAPQSAEAMPNSATPVNSTRRRPKTSPSRPAAMSGAAKASR